MINLLNFFVKYDKNHIKYFRFIIEIIMHFIVGVYGLENLVRNII